MSRCNGAESKLDTHVSGFRVDVGSIVLLYCVCVCVDIEYQNTHSSSKVRTFFQSGAILAGPHKPKGHGG